MSLRALDTTIVPVSITVDSQRWRGCKGRLIIGPPISWLSWLALGGHITTQSCVKSGGFLCGQPGAVDLYVDTLKSICGFKVS